MNQEPKTTDERTAKKTKKPQRKMSDLAPKKDVRGGEFVITSTTSSSSPTLQKWCPSCWKISIWTRNQRKRNNQRGRAKSRLAIYRPGRIPKPAAAKLGGGGGF